ncbi:MAG TPA: sigma-54 dependent transcriptional regulator [Terriglobia bacterium]|nr:sigma-54 dependent transcriptional regulator [Terriglobia bacterium]
MTDLTNAHILLVEDDISSRIRIAGWLEREGCAVTTAERADEAWALLTETAFDALLVDVDLDGTVDGGGLIRNAASLYPQIAAFALGPESAHKAVRAIRAGAQDYISQPPEETRLLQAVRDALAAADRARPETLRAAPPAQRRTAGIVGESAAMRRVFDVIEAVAAGSSTVLITGETGTGKELVAQAIHALSSRRSQKLVGINCGAIPENLLESELFGHVKGAFTGAHQTRIGRFEQANGGTIFLDEIGNMSVNLQVKLLRVLQEREFERVGGLEKIKVDVRIIAATSANLKELIARNEFRSDLYYRLNVIPVQMPALRERRGDIPLLAARFIDKFATEWDAAPKSISQEAMKMLMNYNWPGNVRELENAIERMVAMTGTRRDIVTADLPEEIRQTGGNLFVSEIYIPDEGIDFNTQVSELERRLIIESLRKTNGNRREAAELLQLKRTTLIEKLRRFSIPAELEAASA